MTGVKVTIEGQKAFNDALARLRAGYTKGVQKAVILSAQSVRTAAIRSIQKGGGSGSSHTPSAPGQPPNTDTGRLVASIFAEPEGDGLRAKVGTDVAYGAHLEFGTQKMAARPWLQRALDGKREIIVKRIRTALEAEARRQGRRR